MHKIVCRLLGHQPKSHLDYIYGTLPREHKECKRCGTTTSFGRPTAERETELQNAGDIRDGAVPVCNKL